MAKKKGKKQKSDLLQEVQAINYQYERLMDNIYGSVDLSNEQFNILEILKNQGEGLSLNQIQGLLNHRTSNTTRLVNKLKLKKLVTKKVDPLDKRRLVISINTDGISLYEKVRESNKSFRKKLKKAVDSSSSKSVLADLKALRKSLRALDS